MVGSLCFVVIIYVTCNVHLLSWGTLLVENTHQCETFQLTKFLQLTSYELYTDLIITDTNYLNASIVGQMV
jgi:hypothetical protein